MTTYLGKSCSFCLPRVLFVNCRQFMYLVISLLVLRAGCGIWLYQFLIIAYLFTFQNGLKCKQRVEYANIRVQIIWTRNRWMQTMWTTYMSADNMNYKYMRADNMNYKYMSVDNVNYIYEYRKYELQIYEYRKFELHISTENVSYKYMSSDQVNYKYIWTHLKTPWFKGNEKYKLYKIRCYSWWGEKQIIICK